MVWLRPVVLMSLLLVACGADEAMPTEGEAGGGGSADGCEPGTAPQDDGSCFPAGRQPNGCAAGEGLLGGVCVAAGDPANGCTAGELALDDGSCQPAGVPPAACLAGFEPAPNGGCNAVIPAEPCPAGELALPGETSCRAVAPCGTGPWGDIPLDGTTEHVAGAHSGQSDGTETNPWKQIQDGIDAAEPGAIVAIAAGSYAEDLQVAGKAVRLWGKCPAEAEVVGATIALAITVGADGSEVRDLALSGSGARSASLVLVTRGGHDAAQVVIDPQALDRMWSFGRSGQNFRLAGEPTIRSSHRAARCARPILAQRRPATARPRTRCSCGPRGY